MRVGLEVWLSLDMQIPEVRPARTINPGKECHNLWMACKEVLVSKGSISMYSLVYVLTYPVTF